MGPRCCEIGMSELEMPKVGSLWRHIDKGEHYLVIAYTGCDPSDISNYEKNFFLKLLGPRGVSQNSWFTLSHWHKIMEKKCPSQ